MRFIPISHIKQRILRNCFAKTDLSISSCQPGSTLGQVPGLGQGPGLALRVASWSHKEPEGAWETALLRFKMHNLEGTVGGGPWPTAITPKSKRTGHERRGTAGSRELGACLAADWRADPKSTA